MRRKATECTRGARADQVTDTSRQSSDEDVCCSVLQCVAVCCSVLQCVVTDTSRQSSDEHL